MSMMSLCNDAFKHRVINKLNYTANSTIFFITVGKPDFK